MANDLQDLRTKVTQETWAWLASESRSTGKDIGQIARDHLHAIALQKINKASVLLRLLRSKGIDGESQGAAGDGFPDTEFDAAAWGK